MADRVVIDVSVAIPLVRTEATSATVKARFRQWRTSGMVMVVPAQFWLEITNVLLRRHRRPGSAVIAAVHQLDELGFETVETDRSMILVALHLAERFVLTTYDAVYLALAESLDAQLFTNDRALLLAAGERGVGIGSDGRRLSETHASYGARRPTWPDYRELSALLSKLRADVSSRPGRPG